MTFETKLQNLPSCMRQCTLFGKICLWQFFLAILSFTFWYTAKKNHTYFSESDNFSSRGLVRKETTRFQNVLLVLGKWTTIKFKHCLPGCHSLRSCTDYICMLTYSSAVLLQCDKAGIFIN